MATLVFALLLFAIGFAGGLLFVHARARIRMRAIVATVDTPASSAPIVESTRGSSISMRRFEPLVARGTRSLDLEAHSMEWRAAMRAVGDCFASHGVSAVVFVHGTFTGSDPLSAYGVLQQALPGLGRTLAAGLRKKSRSYLHRLLGDVGTFGGGYVRLFEDALRPEGSRIPCTEFVWSSENHHVGRLEGALGLLRALATHAELGTPTGRLLVVGHSHAGQLFALVTQLLARSVATEAILDIARARSLDVVALETDLATLEGCAIDFVTFGAPTRYAWASAPRVRALHVIGVGPSQGARGLLAGDWVRRLGVEGSDFPPLRAEDRRINASLTQSLGPGFAPMKLAAALGSGVTLPSYGETMLIDYADHRLGAVVTSGFGHGTYTRLDGMLFHARLVAERLYGLDRSDGGAEVKDARPS